MRILAPGGAIAPQLRPSVRFQAGYAEDGQVQAALEKRLRSLFSKPSGMTIKIMENPLDSTGPRVLEWYDLHEGSGIMRQNKVTNLLKRLPELKPAATNTTALANAGYQGFNAPGHYDNKCFALDITQIPGFAHASIPRKTYLVVGKIDNTDFSKEIYTEKVGRRLEARLKAMGLKNAQVAADGYAHDPWVPLFSNTPATPKLLIGFHHPASRKAPTEAEVYTALAKLPEVQPAAAKLPELKTAGYDGYKTRGQYGANCFAVEAALIPGFPANSKLQQTFLAMVENTSTEPIITPDDLAIQAELSQRLLAAGLSRPGIGINAAFHGAPNDFTLSYNGYSAPESEVRAALAKMPELKPVMGSPMVPGMLPAWGQQTAPTSFTLDVAAIPKLAHIQNRVVTLHLSENILNW